MIGKIVIACIAATTVAAENLSATVFAQFVAEHGKNYDTVEEYMMRYKEFAKSYAEILKFNMQEGQTSKVGLNKFADWTNEERAKLRNA